MHFKDGEFHKHYDRQDSAKSMINFLRDPSGMEVYFSFRLRGYPHKA